MHKRERYLAMLSDDRVVRPFEWGLEFIGEDPDSTDPHGVLSKFSVETIANSDEYFSIPESFEFSLRRDAHESVPPAVAGGFLPRVEDPPATAGGTDSGLPLLRLNSKLSGIEKYSSLFAIVSAENLDNTACGSGA